MGYPGFGSITGRDPLLKVNRELSNKGCMGGGSVGDMLGECCHEVVRAREDVKVGLWDWTVASSESSSGESSGVRETLDDVDWTGGSSLILPSSD